MRAMTSVPVINLIGYEGRTIDEFLRVLQRAGVTLLLDVRRHALSRKEGFSKRPLKALAELSGIAYAHLPDWGPPIAMLRDYRVKGSWDEFKQAYLEYVEELLNRTAGIEAFWPDATPCLMCFEADASRCHRSLLAEVLASRSPNGCHIRSL